MTDIAPGQAGPPAENADAAPAQSRVLQWWPKTTKLEKRIRHVVATVLWIYATCQLFLFDADGLLLGHLPSNLDWLVSYKLFVFATVFAVVLLTVKTKRIVAWTIYIAFYPITRLFWGIVYTGLILVKLKSWPVFFTVLNLVLSFFTSAKFNFVASALGVTSAIIILTSTAKTAIWFGITLTLILAVALIVNRYIALFRPSRLFHVYTRMMGGLLAFGQKTLIPDPAVKNLLPANMSGDQLTKWTANLQQAVLFNELCYFLIQKFQDYRKSALPYAYYLLNFVALVGLVIVLLAFANFGLYRIDAKNFALADGHSFFEFFYYTFNAIFLHDISEITPASVATKTLSMIEIFCAAALVGNLLGLMYTVRRQSDDEGTAEAIVELKAQADTMNNFVRTQFSMSVDDAITELERLQKGVGVMLNYLRGARKPGQPTD